MTDVVSIPLSTKVSTSTLENQIHTADKVLLNKKSSIVYQNSLSNMKSKRGSEGTYPLTNGSELEYNANGITIDGTDTYSFDNKYILRKSVSVLDKSRGEWLSSCVYNNNIYTLYRKSKLVIDLYIETFDKTLVDKQTFTGGSNYIYYNLMFSSIYGTSTTPFIIESYSIRNGTSYTNTANARLITDTEWTNIHSATTVASYGPLAPVLYATFINNTYLVVGHYDSDQRRCKAYVRNVTTNTTTFTIDGFGTVSPDGTITGEPIPILTSRSPTSSYLWSNMLSDFGITILSNGQIRWELRANPSHTISGVFDSTPSWTEYGNTYKVLIKSDSQVHIVGTGSTISTSSWFWANFLPHWKIKTYSIAYAVKPVNNNTWTIMEKSDYTPASSPSSTENVYRLGDSPSDTSFSQYGTISAGQCLSASQHISPEQIGEIVKPSTSSEYDNPAGRYWFSNTQADKGKYWDFGPGWCKFMIFVAGPTFTAFDAKGSSSEYSSCIEYTNYACKTTHLYEYGLVYPEYDSSLTSPERRLVSTTIDTNLGNYTMSPTTTNTLSWSEDTSSSLPHIVYTDETDTDSTISTLYQQWTIGGWRLINCTDLSNPFPFFMIADSIYTGGLVAAQGDYNNNYGRLITQSNDTRSLATTGYFANNSYYDVNDLNERGYITYDPTIKCLIGGDISRVDGFINLIPSKVEIVPNSEIEESLFTVQYYGGLPISHGFASTLIDSGSDGRNDHWVYSNPTSGSYYLCADGYIYWVYEWDPATEYELLDIDKIADYRFRTNIIDGYNLILADKDATELKRSFRDYNMYGMFSTAGWTGTKNCPNSSSGAANDTWYYGSGQNVQMLDGSDTTYLFPAVTVPIYVDSDDLSSFNSKVVNGRNPVIQPIMHKSFQDDDTIDVYYTHALSSTDVTYKSTNVYRTYGSGNYLSYGNANFEVDKEGMSWWIDSSVIIFPMGLATEVQDFNYQTPTVKLLDNYYARLYTKNGNTFMSFNETQLLNNASYIFTIYANNYYYDGISIYFAGSDTNTYSSAQFVCYALGMEFLGNSGTEAYFYSAFEKRIYTFTGSNTLQADDSLSKFGNIIDHAYSSHEQILYLLNDKNQLLIKTPLDEAILDLPMSGYLVTTDSGVAVIYGNNGYDIPNPHTGNYTFPFVFESGYIGDSGSLQNVAYVDVMLYNDNDIKNDKVRMGFNVIDEITPIASHKNFEIKGSDWKGNNARIRMVPKNTQGNAFQITISSEDEIKVTAINIGFSQVSTQPNTKNRG